MTEHAGRIRIALAGNPNCGKTTIFNNITGARQHVGNYPGVTVEKKEGTCRFEGRELLFVDLPGTYSLTARSLDEVVARNTIINEKPDVIVNVLDASNLERNLYLAAQLMELERPLVLALNMSDMAKEMGLKLDISKIAERTGAVVIETVGRNNIGTKELLEAVVRTTEEDRSVSPEVDYGEMLEPAVSELAETIRVCGTVTYPIRWAAVKLLEQDADVIEKICSFEGSQPIFEKAEELRTNLKDTVDLDIAFQEARHRFAVSVFNDALLEPVKRIETRSDKIDGILTHRILGLPIFLFIMWSLFTAVIELGAYPQDWLDQGIGLLAEFVTDITDEGPLQSLLVDGIIGGVGAVLSFLPLIVILFLGISFLEDTGYMARAAFVVDRVMRAVGLHGKSFIPMLLGFGCTVPAVMGTRILDNPRDRMVTILVSPFMSCSARLPVYTLLIGAFFPPEQGGTILFGVYLTGILLAVVLAKIFRKVLFAGEAEPFVMEMPPYHMPTLKSVLQHMWERSVLYVQKAGTFILAASVIVWFLVSYPEDVTYSRDFDAVREQVTATYEAKGDKILSDLGVTTEGDKEAVAALVEDIKATAGLHAEELDALAEEEAEGTSGSAETAAGADYVAADVPDVFADVRKSNEALFPAAWLLYENGNAMDGDIARVDLEQSSEKIQQSYAATFGKAIEPIIAPLGYDWKVGVALVAAMAAKEVLVSTLSTIYNVEIVDEEHADSLQEFLAADPNFSPLTALSLMVFVLIYPPCLAALAVIKRETNSWKWLGFVFLYSNAFAWLGAFLVYQIGRMLGY